MKRILIVGNGRVTRSAAKVCAQAGLHVDTRDDFDINLIVQPRPYGAVVLIEPEMQSPLAATVEYAAGLSHQAAIVAATDSPVPLCAQKLISLRLSLYSLLKTLPAALSVLAGPRQSGPPQRLVKFRLGIRGLVTPPAHLAYLGTGENLVRDGAHFLLAASKTERVIVVGPASAYQRILRYIQRHQRAGAKPARGFVFIKEGRPSVDVAQRVTDVLSKTLLTRVLVLTSLSAAKVNLRQVVAAEQLLGTLIGVSAVVMCMYDIEGLSGGMFVQAVLANHPKYLWQEVLIQQHVTGGREP